VDCHHIYSGEMAWVPCYQKGRMAVCENGLE